MKLRRLPWGSLFLALAFAGWLLVTLVPGWNLPLLKAFFDASLVGALADWFAVTALFRRPLGLKLPHTDLLVKRKDELAEALPRFLAGFLQPEELAKVWGGIDYATVLEKHLDEGVLSRLLDDRLATQWGSQALTAGTALLARELRSRKDELLDPVTDLIKRNAGWKGLFVSRESVGEVVEGLLGELEALRDRPDHPLRPLLGQAVREAAGRWQATNPAWGLTPESRAHFNAQVADLLALLWAKTEATERLTEGLAFLLRQTDARVLSERIRSAVSQDLQAIRVNGALVGGLAGVLLAVVSGLYW